VQLCMRRDGETNETKRIPSHINTRHGPSTGRPTLLPQPATQLPSTLRATTHRSTARPNTLFRSVPDPTRSVSARRTAWQERELWAVAADRTRYVDESVRAGRHTSSVWPKRTHTAVCSGERAQQLVPEPPSQHARRPWRAARKHVGGVEGASGMRRNRCAAAIRRHTYTPHPSTAVSAVTAAHARDGQQCNPQMIQRFACALGSVASSASAPTANQGSWPGFRGLGAFLTFRPKRSPAAASALARTLAELHAIIARC
jgi:hypothetical protein